MVRRVASFLVLGLLLTTAAYAQLASQTALVGTVSDAGGLVLPGASVVAVNVGTQDTYETTTNAEGYYNIQFVRPGNYEITVTLAGFQTFKTTGVEVANNQVVRTNAVHAGRRRQRDGQRRGPQRRCSTPTAPRSSETIGERAIVELPLNGRNVWSLASTTPGVLGGLNSDIGLSFRGAGQREIQNSLVARRHQLVRRTCWRRPACGPSPTRSPRSRCRPAAPRPSTAPISACTSTS